MSIDKKWKEFLSEEKGRSKQRGIYKFLCMIGYNVDVSETQRGLEDVLADFRACEHVTIVDVIVKNKKVSSGRYVAGLGIKFTPTVPGKIGHPEHVKRKVISNLRAIPNVMNVYRVSAPLERIE